jgi:DNA polymerase III epsilon subunit-like protein
MTCRQSNLHYGDIHHVKRLSAALSRPIVALDIEHTGYKAEGGITEFAAIVFDKTGEIDRVNTLLNPGPVKFNPVAMRLSMISPRMMNSAPSYTDFVGRFVSSHANSLWVGFNSNSSDLPFITSEHARFGGGQLEFKHKLDVMRLTNDALKMKGSLSLRFAGVIEHDDTHVAHVAMTDVAMTVALLNHTLGQIDASVLKRFGLNV